MPRPMRRRLAPKKSADPTLPHTSPVREGCWLSLLRSSRTNHVSLVKSPERRPWALKREGRPAAFAGRSESVLLGWDTGLAYTSEYPIPSAKRSVNLRSDRTGKDQGAVFFRTSSATKWTRYNSYYGLSRPWAPLPYSHPHGSSTCGFSVPIGVPGSHVPLNRLWQAQAT